MPTSHQGMTHQLPVVLEVPFGLALSLHGQARSLVNAVATSLAEGSPILPCASVARGASHGAFATELPAGPALAARIHSELAPSTGRSK